jgi:hypothetical protein
MFIPFDRPSADWVRAGSQPARSTAAEITRLSARRDLDLRVMTDVR